ncbi:hypothetical protein [Rheinheimera gaetbuli]
MLLAKLLPIKLSAAFLTYLAAIVLLALWLLISKIMPVSQADARLLTLPEAPAFTPATFVSAKNAAASWQIPPEAQQNTEQEQQNSTAAVRDQFEHNGQQYQLLGIFSAATPFAVIKVLDPSQAATNAPAQQVKLHDDIGTLKVADISKYQVCLSGADIRQCLYLFKSDVKLSKAQ